ncbi:MAG: hypothetical protein ACFCUO_01185 [Rhodospirillales bacterium]
MNNLQRLGRVLCRHDWRNLHEWVAAIDHLADLSEQEIAEMVGCGSSASAPSDGSRRAAPLSRA